MDNNTANVEATPTTGQGIVNRIQEKTKAIKDGKNAHETIATQMVAFMEAAEENAIQEKVPIVGISNMMRLHQMALGGQGYPEELEENFKLTIETTSKKTASLKDFRHRTNAEVLRRTDSAAPMLIEEATKFELTKSDFEMMGNRYLKQLQVIYQNFTYVAEDMVKQKLQLAREFKEGNLTFDKLPLDYQNL
jgi:hypothetical protein